MNQITPMLWFDGQAEQAARFYASVFKKAKVGEPMKGPDGKVLVMPIEIAGLEFSLLNGGPQFKFNESVSLCVPCKTQREIDTYWKKLLRGGGKPVQCGWLIDKYSVRWQITPAEFDKWNTSKNKKKKEAVMHAMWQMVKLDHNKLREAFARA